MRTSWILVFQDYLIDETSSYEKLAEKYQVSKRSIVRHAVKEQWKLKREQILQKSIQNVTKNSTEFLTEVKKKHIELAHKLQEKALEELANGNFHIKSASQLVTILKAGIELERKCWEIQVTLDHMQELPEIPSIPISKNYEENMEKIEQVNEVYQAKFSSWLVNN